MNSQRNQVAIIDPARVSVAWAASIGPVSLRVPSPVAMNRSDCPFRPKRRPRTEAGFSCCDWRLRVGRPVAGRMTVSTSCRLRLWGCHGICVRTRWSMINKLIDTLKGRERDADHITAVRLAEGRAATRGVVVTVGDRFSDQGCEIVRDAGPSTPEPGSTPYQDQLINSMINYQAGRWIRAKGIAWVGHRLC